MANRMLIPKIATHCIANRGAVHPILCRNHSLAPKDSKQLFASKYMPVLPTEEERIAEIEREIRLLNLLNDKEV